MIKTITKSLLCGLALMIAGLTSVAHADFMPSRQDQQLSQAITGYWYLQDTASGLWGQLNLNSDGTCHLNLTRNQGQHSSSSGMNGRWRLERNMIVIETSDTIERFPIRYGNDLLEMDIAALDACMVFARNIADSYIKPLNLPGMGQKRIANRIAK